MTAEQRRERERLNRGVYRWVSRRRRFVGGGTMVVPELDVNGVAVVRDFSFLVLKWERSSPLRRRNGDGMFSGNMRIRRVKDSFCACLMRGQGMPCKNKPIGWKRGVKALGN
ncbi:hypothetical protein U1Q18_031074 [Sarracenia purpurea var. burkii]